MIPPSEINLIQFYLLEKPDPVSGTGLEILFNEEEYRYQIV
jgi:hypothetical protein